MEKIVKNANINIYSVFGGVLSSAFQLKIIFRDENPQICTHEIELTVTNEESNKLLFARIM